MTRRGSAPSLRFSWFVRSFALSETAEQLKASPELHCFLAEHLKEYSGEMESGVREITAKLEQGESRTPALDLDRMRIVAKHVHPIDADSPIVYEIRKARTQLERIRSSRPESGSRAQRNSSRKHPVHRGGGVKLIIPLPEAGLDERNFYAGLASGVHRSPNRRGEAGRLPLRLRRSAISQEHHSDQTAAPAKLQAAIDAPPQTPMPSQHPPRTPKPYLKTTP
ncbi:MAG: hypothetical protein QXO02_09630 [Thermofilaceae archaeon]